MQAIEEVALHVRIIRKAIERAREMDLEQLTLGVVSTNERAKSCMNL